MQLLAITAVGEDRPGIVAEFSGALFHYGCNLEECTMTRLRGEFAMILLVKLSEGRDAAGLEELLTVTAARMGLSVVIRPAEPPTQQSGLFGGESYILRVYGADHPGIVFAVTQLLARHAWNITDLNTRVIPGADGPLYVMLLEVESPRAGAAEALREELARLRSELQVEIGIELLEPEAL